MNSLLLFLIATAGFIFYGVAGQDKTWILAPLYLLSYAAITIALLKRASRMTHGGDLRAENAKLPIATVLWIAFLFYGIALIPQAVVPFEAKLVMLFTGGVVGAYLVWGAELTTFKDNRILLGLLIFVVMLTALYGLIVHFKCPERVLWAERYAVYEGRLMSTYICPNHFAHLMQMLLPFCVVLLFIPQAGIYLRILSAYSFMVFLPPLYLTESRAGWLGSLVAVGATICLMALRRSRKLFALLVILVPLCAFLLLLGGWKYSETFQRRMKPVVEFLQHQNEEGVGSEAKDFRPQTWMDTIDMIRESPLIGFGPGNYRYTFPEHRKRFRGTRIVTGHPHNEYLELIADYGLVGFGLFALAWCYGLIRILMASLKAKETRHAFLGFAFLGTAAGTMVHSFFDFQMHIYPNALVFALLAALAWGPLAARQAKGIRPASGATDNFRKEIGTPCVGSKARGTGQEGNGTGRLASGNRGTSELSAVGADLLAIADASNLKPHTSNVLCPLWLRKAGAWLLAVGYLLGALICLQVMSSAFIRSLGDRRFEESGTRHSALGDKRSPAKMYSLAANIDPQNWRAYKGMGNLLFGRRYYTLERDEKNQWAEQERSWYKKAYGQNPKDPEICMVYGQCLIFLGKNQGTRNSALGSRVDEITATGRSGGGMASSLSTDIGDDVPPDSDLKAIRQQPLAISQKQSEDSMQQTANYKLQTANSQIAQGLDLLREACRYRPYNDVYWWNLGAELRRAGQYEEALDVFNHAASIKRTPSTRKNIEWLEARLKALDERHMAADGTAGGAVDDLPLQAGPPKINTAQSTVEKPAGPVLDLNVSGAAADPGLMDLLEKMGE